MYTFLQLYSRYWNSTAVAFAKEFGFRAGNLNSWLNGSIPRDPVVRERLMDALEEISGKDWRGKTYIYPYVTRRPTQFASLEQLFEHLGVKVEVDESQYYKYTIVESHE